MTDKPDDSKQTAKAAGPDKDDDDLNKVLASWDEDNSDSKKPKPAKKDDSPLAKEVAQMRYKLEMRDIIPIVKGKLAVDDKLVEAYVNMRGGEDPRLLDLWDNRDNNRSAFETAMKALGGDFAKVMSKKEEDRPLEDDKGLAAAAHMARVSKVGSGDLDNLNFGTMSDTEFAFKKQEIFRLAKQGKLT